MSALNVLKYSSSLHLGDNIPGNGRPSRNRSRSPRKRPEDEDVTVYLEGFSAEILATDPDREVEKWSIRYRDVLSQEWKNNILAIRFSGPKRIVCNFMMILYRYLRYRKQIDCPR